MHAHISAISAWFYMLAPLIFGVVSDIAGVMKEYIEPEIANIQEREIGLWSKFKRGKAHPVSSRASRLEAKVAQGGVSAGTNWDGGALPVGTNPTVAEMLVSTVGLSFSQTITDKMRWATDQDVKAIAAAMSMITNEMMREWGVRLDISLQGDGSGTRAIIKDASTDVPPQYSVAATGNPQATYWLREGEKYDIYDTTLATLRAGGPYQIVANGGILPETQDVTFTASITGATALDVIVGLGMKNADLVGLAAFISDSTSSTIQNVARTTPWVVVRSVDAGSSKLDWSHIRLSLNKIRQRKGSGKENLKGLVPYTSMAQQQNYEDAAQAISQIVRSSGASSREDNFDLMMEDGKVQGRDVMTNIHADPTKFQWVDFDAFMRLEMKKMDFYKDPMTGSYFQPLYGTAVGGITPRISMYQMSLCYQAQLACKNFTGMSYVKNLTVPGGYITN